MNKIYLRVCHSEDYACYSLNVYESKEGSIFAKKTKEYRISYSDEKTLLRLKEDLDELLRKELSFWKKIKWAIFGVSR